MANQPTAGPARQQAGIEALSRVRNIIAVGSGKGGVGKSTVAANLAAALQRRGRRVGLLDADIYGPSQPDLLGAVGAKPEVDGDVIVPLQRHGIGFVSMGLMLGKDQPAIWRAPIAMKLIQQFLGGVAWGELDDLLIDLPPGTGDVQLTLSQQASLTGAVVVTTPQQVALGVARKGLRMFETVNVPILGVVENMSGFTCAHCGEVTPVFSTGGGEAMAAEIGVPYLGALPLDPQIGECGEAGVPVVIRAPESAAATAYGKLADRLLEEVAREAADGTVKPVNIEMTADGRLAIAWSDGHRGLHAPYDLRVNCQCASCRDENTGRRTLDPDKVPLDITVHKVQSIGRYALAFDFSDGHTTGIYRYDFLRGICGCDECVAKRGGKADSFSV